MNKDWWKEAIVYQIYPKSFCDSNGDGIGDIKGIVSKLDYLKKLGVTVIWICPMYQSPMSDNGYDISDYYQIAEQFGTNEDFEVLICEANKFGIKIIIDLVLNHCSDQHQWFQKALNEPGSKEEDYFYFVKAKDKKLPNNWRSNFGGSVWEPVKGNRYYFHTFGKKQPDLNWENAELRQKLYDMINWWLEKGISGFRIDAITFIKKDTSFNNHFPVQKDGMYPIENLENYEGIDAFLSELKSNTYGKRNCLTVAEAPGVPLTEISKYSGENGYFSMIFEFSYSDMNIYTDEWSVGSFKNNIISSQIEAQKGGWLGLFLENHDMARSPNKYISSDNLRNFGDLPKKMLATLYFLLRGTPFLYQGQEIGMENYPFETIEDFRDVMDIRKYKEMIANGDSEEKALKRLCNIARDNGRTPMQWENTAYAGFSSAKPWINVNPNYLKINVKAQEKSENSILNYYKKLIALRKDAKSKEVFVYGDFIYVDTGTDSLIAYIRKFENKTVIVVCNLSAQVHQFELPYFPKNILISNYDKAEINIRSLTCLPFQAVAIGLSDKVR